MSESAGPRGQAPPGAGAPGGPSLPADGSVGAFAASKPYPLDPFQLQACEALADERDVVVCAPTGSGKTVVGEYAIARALSAGRRACYTTPLKALSNQKHEDLVALWGEQNVGLVTGDVSLNPRAPVVVMTTEILRNMIYAGSPDVDEFGVVVLDEVHYLADPLRGPIWEEIVITAPAGIQIAALSATVSNSQELGDWLRSVRGETDVIATSHRPVPLYNHVLYNGRLLDLLADDGTSLNPAIARLALLKDHRRARPVVRSRAEVIAQLDKEGLLPAIYFIFSRAGCEAAAQQCITSGLRLIPPTAGQANLAALREQCGGVPRAELDALGYGLMSAALERGYAPHHAGLLPAFRLTVEHLFAKGTLRTVFATETLALGINMPARTVVLDRLDKWNGQSHVDLTPGEYIQLTGRAGRRGIDIEGHAVISSAGPARVKKQLALVTAKPGPLRSAFKPSYNMAVNLLAERSVPEAHEILAASFAQFQADRSVVGLAAQLRRTEAEAAPLRAQLTCELGDLPGYFALRRACSRAEAEASSARSGKRSEDKFAAVRALRPGDVIWLPRGRFKGLAVMLDARWDGRGRFERREMLLESGEVRAVEVRQLAYPFLQPGHVKIPRSFNPKVPRQRRDALSAARELVRGQVLTAPGRDPEPDPAAAGELAATVTRLRDELRAHPCHRCPGMAAHEQLAHRLDQLEQDAGRMRERLEHATGSLPKAFARICSVLEQLGLLTVRGDHAALSADGARLRRIYGENDLLAALALREGALDGPLSEAEMAGVVSGLVAERRGDDGAQRPRGHLPAHVRAAIGRIEALAAGLAARESGAGLPERRPLDFTFAGSLIAWLQGADLAAVLATAGATPGDFLRVAQQLEDLVGQLARIDGDDAALVTLRATHPIVRAKLAAFRR